MLFPVTALFAQTLRMFGNRQQCTMLLLLPRMVTVMILRTKLERPQWKVELHARMLNKLTSHMTSVAAAAV